MNVVEFESNSLSQRKFKNQSLNLRNFVMNLSLKLINKFRIANIFRVEPEPETSIWNASLVNAIPKSYLSKQLVFLDYGCGRGTMAEFLLRRFKCIEYIGLERSTGNNGFGERELRIAKLKLFGIRNCKFGYLETNFANHSIAKADIIFLGSIFTHTTFEEMEKVLDLLKLSVKDECLIIFTFFESETKRYEGANYYGYPDVFHKSFFEFKAVNRLIDKIGFKLSIEDHFITRKRDRHSIAVIKRNKSCKI